MRLNKKEYEADLIEFKKTGVRHNRIEYNTPLDKDGKCSFFLYWFADYHPGDPGGEYRIAERCQVFYANPLDHGFPIPPKQI